MRDEKQWKFDATPHCGFYTQEDAREIVAYAKARFINVVPEIEMPGHAVAAIAAYPELGITGEPMEVATRWGIFSDILNADPATITFMQTVLTEVLAIFTSRDIHIGGDEADKAKWKASPRIQARIKELGLADEHALQSWFIRQMDTFLTSKGRRLVGWDEILEGGLAENAEYMPNPKRVEYMAFPRLTALSEVVWTPKERKNYADYLQRLEPHLKRLTALDVNFRPLDK